ncbi:sulfur transferase domain-containing protein [Corallococcus sp. BB11-1]|uniref:beta-lactamase hydrolase domain-containing protein n=1 Tax=Corallococcus sp. BB11-1 TaxID=2996783 RepID=UPI00226F9D54|nr:sulfur transferase domain-containing protein [Corallococcus sp. BB11-1]MCY1036066.1 sulfur transferase domain-containing protein [Corallococcus sp. BB11-1]
MTAERIKVSERFTVEMSPPTRDRVEALAAEGFRSLVNLRTAEEEGQALSPDEEGEVARRHGLQYRHVPVSPSNLGAEVARKFDEEVAHLPAPTVVHCASGRRAGLFTLMHVARAEGLSGDDAIARAERLGFELNKQAKSLFRQHVDGEGQR